jgi:hypothetical protein
VFGVVVYFTALPVTGELSFEATVFSCVDVQSLQRTDVICCTGISALCFFTFTRKAVCSSSETHVENFARRYRLKRQLRVLWALIVSFVTAFTALLLIPKAHPTPSAEAMKVTKLPSSGDAMRAGTLPFPQAPAQLTSTTKEILSPSADRSPYQHVPWVGNGDFHKPAALRFSHPTPVSPDRSLLSTLAEVRTPVGLRVRNNVVV